MNNHSTMGAAWRSMWSISRDHQAPIWAQVLLAIAASITLALGLMGTAAVFATVDHPNWFLASLLPNILICCCIALALLAAVRAAEKLLPLTLVERIGAGRDRAAGALLGAIAVVAIVLGMWLGYTLTYYLDFRAFGQSTSLPAPLFKFALFLFAVIAANWAWWRARMRHEALRREALESQLRMLQAQIEPHFLFNTLANVQSLMDYDPPRAKQMVEAFSDYLRAGLAQLREADSTLGAELAMGQTYLDLLELRMQERLTYSIEASAQARAAQLPTLLLQPLVENAIHHGLEPKIEGGHVRIVAEVRSGSLHIHVDDDGLGLDAPRRALRAGTGMAVANLRARLHTRYGAAATLELVALAQGTRASIKLPYKASA